MSKAYKKQSKSQMFLMSKVINIVKPRFLFKTVDLW